MSSENVLILNDANTVSLLVSWWWFQKAGNFIGLAILMTVLVYNRIAKAGSTTMIALLAALSKVNNFTIRDDSQYFPDYNSLKGRILDSSNDSVYINHCNYVDNLPGDFVWINMVREPLSRAESMFYYEVSPTRGKAAENDLQVRMADVPCGCPYDEFDACYRKRYANPRCQDRLALDTPASMYFSEPSAHSGNTSSTMLYHQMVPNWTPEKAFERVKDKYVFVGLDEEFELSVRMFEHLLPRFFRNATAVYHSTKASHANRTPRFNSRTKTSMGGAITTFVREVLTEHNRAEVALYQNIKRLFWWKVAQYLPGEISFGTH